MVSKTLSSPGRLTASRRALRAAAQAAVAAWACWALAPAWSATAAPAISVPTIMVGRQASATGFEVEGTLQAVQQSVVSARVSGSVLLLAVKAGQSVKAGQLLARMDDRELLAGVAAGNAAVAQAQAAQTQAQQQLQRQRDLRAQGFLSAAALDSATAQAQAASAAVQQAQAMRQQAALAAGFASVTAPFDGVVLATHVEAGELATPGRPLVTVYAPGRLRAVVQLPSNRAQAARTAPTTEVLLPDGRRLTPTARQELPGADAVSQTTEWRLELGPRTGATAGTAGSADTANTAPLQPGQAVRVRFAGAANDAADGPANAAANAAANGQASGQASGASAASANTTINTRLTVPTTAVLQRGELQAVYVAQEGRFVLKAVRLGATAGAQQEVLAGLKSGERVALDPVRAGLAGAVPAAQ